MHQTFKSLFIAFHLAHLTLLQVQLKVTQLILFQCLQNLNHLVFHVQEVKNRVFLATGISKYSLACSLNFFHFTHFFVDYSVGDSMSLKQLITAIALFKVFSNAFSPSSFEILDSLCFYDFDAIVYTEAQFAKYFKKDISFVNGSFANVKLNADALLEWFNIFVELCGNSITLLPECDVNKAVTSAQFNT